MESFFGIGGPELLLILVLATIILGPLNMIKLARQLGILLRDLRNYYNSLTANLSEELGDLAALQETIKGEFNSAMPQAQELQITMPDLAAEARQALASPIPNQPATDPSEPTSTPELGTTSVQLDAPSNEPVSSTQAEPDAASGDAGPGESDYQPATPEQAEAAHALPEESQS
jgi:Sec-independent protein translocase protein TatA